MKADQKHQAGLISNLLSKVPRRNFLRKTLGALAGAGAAATTAAAATPDAVSPEEGRIWTPPGVAEPLLGTIVMVGFNFAPRGWALCDGQLLPISQNTALFALLGTIYGGDGRTTFALPDLRGRAPIHAGQGPGLSDRRLGSKSGSENETLTTAQIPSHSHPIAGTPDVLIRGTASEVRGIPTGSDEETSSLTDTDNVGGGQSHNNMQPFLTVNYIIALQGVFPSRN